MKLESFDDIVIQRKKRLKQLDIMQKARTYELFVYLQTLTSAYKNAYKNTVDNISIDSKSWDNWATNNVKFQELVKSYPKLKIIFKRLINAKKDYERYGGTYENAQ